MINIDELIEKTNAVIKESANDLNNEIEKDVVYSLLSGNNTFYEVDHGFDPPWDWSGVLVENGVIDINSTTFNEYLDMYNGHSYPSFCSGCGMFHRRNYEDFDEMIMTWAWEIQNNVILEMILSADKHDLYEWLTKQKYNHLDAHTYDEFVENFDDCVEDVCFTITDFIDGETIAFYTYEIVKLLSVFQEDPLLSTLVRRHKKEVLLMIKRNKKEAERKGLITNEINKHIDVFVSELKNKLPNTKSFFNGRKIEKGKGCQELRKRFFEEFTHEEIALIAYFEPYHFSNSILASLPKDVKNMIDDERERLRAIYEQKYPSEQ